jgi:hypothetical protein
MTDSRLLVQLDGRGRVSLASVVGAEPHSYYLADLADDGVITLTPAVVTPLIGKENTRSEL